MLFCIFKILQWLLLHFEIGIKYQQPADSLYCTDKIEAEVHSCLYKLKV